MFALLLLIAAIAGIGALARRRGGSPAVWSAVAATGAALLGYLVVPVLIEADVVQDLVLPNLAAVFPAASMWVWIALIALWVRFGLGAGRPSPTGMWTCPACKMLNTEDALVCDACRKPWQDKT